MLEAIDQVPRFWADALSLATLNFAPTAGEFARQRWEAQLCVGVDEHLPIENLASSRIPFRR